MKFKNKKYFLLLPLVALTSCGYSLDYIVEGNKYNSPVFSENYYRHWDDELKNAKQGLSVDVENNITTFSDLFKIDASVYDKYKTSDDYGEDYKMNLVDDMFNYGYQLIGVLLRVVEGENKVVVAPISKVIQQLQYFISQKYNEIA